MRLRICLTITAAICLLVPAPLHSQSKDKNKDPDEIGNRDVGQGVNFYSLEKEIALGKQMAQEIERQARFVNAPGPANISTGWRRTWRGIRMSRFRSPPG